MPRVHDILEPSANEQAMADYLEKQMRHMSSVRLPSSLPPSRDDIPLEDEGLSRRIHEYCSRIDHRGCEKDTHHVTLNSIKEYKAKQQQQTSQKERDEVSKGMSCNLEKVREVTQNTLSRASTISAEERCMALTETDAAPPNTEVLETSPKVINMRSDQENSSRRNTITREMSGDDALAATRCFFNNVNGRRNVSEVPEMSATGVSQIDTPPIPLDPIETEPAEPGTASPRVNLPSGSPPGPTVTATC